MKISFLVSAFFLQLFYVVNAAPNPKPLIPELDPFYTPPKGYESTDPGTVLRSRKTPHKLRSIYLPLNVKDSWQILVRSTDSFGNATAIVTSVIAPYNADPSKMVSYQFAEDGSNTTCSPSYSIQFGAQFVAGLEIQFEMFYVSTLLDKGYYIVLPDYEGPKSAFTAGRNAGQATLDSLRAAYTTANMTGLDPDAKTALWGYSGGTIASAWATVLLEDYAPELKPKLLGAALGGFVTNITATAEAVNGDLFAGLIANAINGLQQEYPELDKYVLSKIRPSMLESYNYAKKTCIVGSVVHFGKHDFFGGNASYFPMGWSVLDDPIPRKVISENTLALKNNTEYPHIPIFIYHGLLDHVVPHKDAQRAYDNWCKWGQAQSIELSSDMTTGHITEFVEGAPAALVWIEDRFKGKPTVKGCKDTTRFSNLLYPGVNKTFVDLLHGVTSAVFTKPLGPNGENITTKDIEIMKRDYLAW
jgi:pimeloyl-ACP methyl ester carboxylesterase